MYHLFSLSYCPSKYFNQNQKNWSDHHYVDCKADARAVWHLFDSEGLRERDRAVILYLQLLVQLINNASSLCLVTEMNKTSPPLCPDQVRYFLISLLWFSLSSWEIPIGWTLSNNWVIYQKLISLNYLPVCTNSNTNTRIIVNFSVKTSAILTKCLEY